MGREVTPHTMSQNEKILHYLETHDYISQYEACMELGCFRLSARISDLRMKGYNIISTLTCKKNAEGNTVKFSRYSLVKES